MLPPGLPRWPPYLPWCRPRVLVHVLHRCGGCRSACASVAQEWPCRCVLPVQWPPRLLRRHRRRRRRPRHAGVAEGVPSRQCPHGAVIGRRAVRPLTLLERPCRPWWLVSAQPPSSGVVVRLRGVVGPQDTPPRRTTAHDPEHLVAAVGAPTTSCGGPRARGLLAPVVRHMLRLLCALRCPGVSCSAPACSSALLRWGRKRRCS